MSTFLHEEVWKINPYWCQCIHKVKPSGSYQLWLQHFHIWSWLIASGRETSAHLKLRGLTKAGAVCRAELRRHRGPSGCLCSLVPRSARATRSLFGFHPAPHSQSSTEISSRVLLHHGKTSGMERKGLHKTNLLLTNAAIWEIPPRLSKETVVFLLSYWPSVW